MNPLPTHAGWLRIRQLEDPWFEACRAAGEDECRHLLEDLVQPQRGAYDLQVLKIGEQPRDRENGK